MLKKLCWTAILCAALSPAQDVMKAAPGHYKVLSENEHVRVVQNTPAPGEKGAPRTHAAGWYYVTKPGTMKVVFATGQVTIWKAKAGEAAWMEAEAPHTSENIGKTTLSYVLVEVKGAANWVGMRKSR